jgi:hypothetical protein
MFRVIVATALFASLAVTARANDVVDSLKNRALASAAAPVAKQSSDAPFLAARDPMPILLMQEEQDRRDVRGGGSCEAAARDLCFDAASGRIVYRSARKFMPKFDGLTPESMSVRSNRVTLKYSFR